MTPSLVRLVSCALGLALVLVTPVAAAPPPEDARKVLARAVALHQAGDLEGAVAAYRESLALAPSVEARSNLGAALAALGRTGRRSRPIGGLSTWRRKTAASVTTSRSPTTSPRTWSTRRRSSPRCTRGSPEDTRTTLLLADCRLQLGEPAAVEDLLRPLAATRPDDRALTYLLGMALIRGGKVQEGQRLVEALMRDGDSAEAQYLVGSAAFVARDYPQAVERFSRALAKDPKLPSLRSYYGRALLFTGDADGAERAFREALAENPNDYEASYFLASVLATAAGRRTRGRSRSGPCCCGRTSSPGEGASSLRSTPGRAATPPLDVSPLVGHAAPDVELRRPDGSAFPLSSLRGRPLVLVLGSYTCPQLRHGVPEVNRLYERHRDHARFLLAYIREAHPEGEAWQSTVNRREGIASPRRAAWRRGPSTRRSVAGS